MAKTDPLLRQSHNDTYLGFDFGDKKIGIAVGHSSTQSASPLRTVKSIQKKPNWQIIGELIKQWQPAGLVVGISRQIDGSDNPVTPRMLKFTRQLHGRYHLPVHQVDEALTTFEAKQMLYDDVQLSADKLWEVQDQLAAQLILQTWFNSNPNP